MIKCNHCDKESWRWPEDLYRGHRDCAGCSRNDPFAAAEKLKKKLYFNNVIMLGEYVNGKKLIEVKHKTCGTVYRILPKKYIYGKYNRYNCPYCSKFVRNFIKQVKFGNLKANEAILTIEENGLSTRLDDLRRFLLNGCTTNN